MKPPLRYHPLVNLLTGLLVAAVVFALGTRAGLPPPLDVPFSFLAVGVGVLLGLLSVLAEALDERATGEEHLRCQVRGRVCWRPGRYWWIRALAIVFFVYAHSHLGVIWLLGGSMVGVAAAYPYYRGHWQRLQRFVENESLSAEGMTG
jgi:hypothetical protein